MGSQEQTGLAQLPTDQLRQLVHGLNSLMEGESAASMLVACGPRAIPYVAEFLLRGRPASVSEPRRRAVKVLADLGAVSELLTYVELDKKITDPVVKLAEESVESLAAELLARWPTEDVFRALLSLAQGRKLIGLCVAFGQMRRSETIPILIRDLADGVCARPAEDALLQIGRIAIPELISAASKPQGNGEPEVPSNLQRRQSALRVLRGMNLRHEDWPLIRPLSHDGDPEVRVHACIIGLSFASEAEGGLLASRMLASAGKVHWLVQSDIQDAMVANYAALGWTVRQFAEVPTRAANDPCKRLALAIVRAASGEKIRPLPTVSGANWLSRLLNKLASAANRRRGEDG